MSQADKRSDADRNLLFGMLALQMNFISRDALIAAMHAWVLAKHKPLGQILLEQGLLTAEQVQALDALIVQHRKAHGDDAQRSLQALPEKSAVRSLLAPVAHDDVQSTVARTLGSQGGRDEKNAEFSLAEGSSRYPILRPHAPGGMGLVFVAGDQELHREVALKEIKPEYADDLACRGRFVLEAEITGGLEHPGIVPVYGLGVYSSGRPYYAMRFIRGDNLKDAIKQFHAAEKPDRDPGGCGRLGGTIHMELTLYCARLLGGGGP